MKSGDVVKIVLARYVIALKMTPDHSWLLVHYP